MTLAALDAKALIVTSLVVVVPAVFFGYLYVSEALARRRLNRSLRRRQDEERSRN